jgi:hypothetical protein
MEKGGVFASCTELWSLSRCAVSEKLTGAAAAFFHPRLDKEVIPV